MFSISANNFPYVQPDFNRDEMHMYRFLQNPPSIFMNESYYENKNSVWNADIHLLATYCFLSNDEKQIFASTEQLYLFKDVFRYKFDNVTGSKRLKLISSTGMVSSWMFYLQRNDVNLRNEWSNYTNWPYLNPPKDIERAPNTIPDKFLSDASYNNIINGPQTNPNARQTGFFVTGVYSVENAKHILETMGILLNGEYRENTLTRGVYDYVEKYTRTKGSAKEGLYCYNFCLNTNPFEYQPSGAINMSKFNSIELEITTMYQNSMQNQILINICDENGNPLGVNKQNWRLFEYNYNLTFLKNDIM